MTTHANTTTKVPAFRMGKKVKLSPAFLARYGGNSWMNGLVGTYQGPVSWDIDKVKVLWEGHKRTQYVSIRNLVKG